MADRLVEMKIEDLAKLQELYKPARSVKDGYIGLMTIESHIRWLKQDPQLKNVRFFCLNGDYSDGTFAVTVSKCF